MSDIPKSIEMFLQKNGLTKTLKSFQGQSKKASNLSSKNIYSSLSGIKNVKIPTDQVNQNQIREHLQKTDAKHLKRFVEKVKGASRHSENEGYSKLVQMPFFKKLVEKEVQNYEQYKQNILQSFNTPPRFLDESRIYQNEWEGQNDQGYQFYECQPSQLPRLIKQIQASRQYKFNPVKEVPYPQAYFSVWEQLKTTSSHNHHDKMKTRLPPNVVFEPLNKKSNKSVYPLEEDDKTLGKFDLKVIYDRQKTGYQDERQMKIVINEVLAGRFQIISLLGQAQFSKAIEVIDLTSSSQKQRYCIKMILNNKDYLDQALDQIKLLKLIKNNCNPDQSCIVNMHQYFYHREHLMILTELLKQNLYDVYRQNPNYFTLDKIQLVAKQILTALSTLHKLHIIHNDLKPQNILVKSYSGGLIKVIDVGSSVFFHDDLQFYVQTRNYRAPQIILGCPYTEKIDIWSLGCIIAQLYIKEMLFNGDCIAAILANIQGLRGPWPSWMLQKGEEVQKYFTKELIIFEEIFQQSGEQGKKKKKKSGFTKVYIPKLTNLQSRLKTDNKNFLDFLSKCLKIDPSARLSSKQALNHPFITQPLN